ncbi:MAG: hypothetical protein JSR98_12060 [Proteobacteria bacterium]|nr:hypothetical protein [Pseudomonadota bacterium]
MSDPRQEDLEAAALEELDQAAGLGWKQLSGLTPWGDTFEGFTPAGREVCFERSYLWENAAGGDIRIEVTVYEPQAYEHGARAARTIARDTGA